VNLPAFFDRLFTLCLTPAVTAGPAKAFVLWSMWFLMAVAMFLPSAAPLIRTYGELADKARTKRQLVVHPFVLIAGYLLVWLVAALGFAAATMFIQGRIALSSAPAPLTGFAGAAALALAGLYQFSSLKLACLEKCRHPFAILFSRWSPRPAAVFRLGIEQGGWCLGCCWALMFVMFAVGIMNIFWMALGAVFAVVEKQVEGHLASRLAGAILLVWALALLVVSA
jgi:predicted metal-binding membrane protein